jgi:hypothetical protein
MSKPGLLKPRDNAQHGAAYYADLYKVPYKTVSKWRSKGYPMDDPQKLLETVMAQKSTAKSDLRGLRDMADAQADGKARKAGPAPKTRDVPALDPEFEPTEEGLMGQLQRLEHEAKRAYADYVKATKPLDKKDLFELWQGIIAEMRQVAKVAPDAELASGQLMKVSEAEATWLRALAEISTTLEAIPRRIAMHPKMKGISAVTIEQVVMDEITKVKKLFHKGKTREDSKS